MCDLSNDPDSYAIPGFALGDETGPGERGFSLGESEINISANVDDKFYGQPDRGSWRRKAVFRCRRGLRADPRSVGSGFTLKAGRFYSGVGYLNEQHAHSGISSMRR